MRTRTHTKKPFKPFALFYKYWISAVLLVVLISLIRQNFIINKFPISLLDKQTILNQAISRNQTLDQKNEIKRIELKAQTANDREVLESQARYRFGLIKKGEIYYQINATTLNSPKALR